MRCLALGPALVVVALGAWPAGCAENEGVNPSHEAFDGGDVITPPDAAEASAPDAPGEEVGAPLPSCSEGGFCRTELPTKEILYSLWGSPDGSIWAGGARSIWHYEDGAWKAAFTWPEGGAPEVRARILVGTGPEDVWAFGDSPEFDPEQSLHPVVMHLARRGSELAWRAVTTDLTVKFSMPANAWAASPTDLWLAWGNEGLWHLHGEDEHGYVSAERELDEEGQPCFMTPTGVWGSGTGWLYAAGYHRIRAHVLLRRDADGHWSPVLDSLYRTPLSLAGTGAGEPRLWTYDGTATTTARAVQADGVLAAPELTRTTGDTPLCRGVRMSIVRDDLGWLSDGTTVCRYEKGAFEVVPITVGGPPRFKVNAIWSNGKDTWVVGEEKSKLADGIGRGFALHRREP